MIRSESKLVLELQEENKRLRQKNLDLIFIIQDCWPYLHAHCTIRTIMNKVCQVLFERDFRQ
jgi:hypothetical protein